MRSLTAKGTMAALLGVVAGIACGAAPGARPKNVGTSAGLGAARPAITPRASGIVPRWELHPPGGAHARAKLDLGRGAIYVTDGGARWIVQDNVAESAPTLLPEALATVMRADDAGLWFVSMAGNVYPAREPLGETGEPRRAPFPLHSLSAGHVALVGLAESGRLMRTLYGGASWGEVKLAGKPATMTEVALDRSGEGLALMGPSELLTSNDDGATWKPIASRSALSVFVGTDGALYAEHGKGDFSVLRGGSLAPAAGPSRVFVLPQSSDARPRVSALRRGAAAFDGTRLVSLELAAAGASIVSDTMGEPPRFERAPDLDGCKQAWPAIAGSAIAVACDGRAFAEAREGWVPLRILKRDAPNTAFREEAVLGSGQGEKHVWLSPRGAIFVTGGCATKDARGGCQAPDALAKPAGATSFIAPKTNPPRKNVAYLFWYVAYSATGDRLYALADDVNNVHGRTMLLVSKDDGVTFAERFLPVIPAPGGLSMRPGHTGGLFPASDGTLRVTALATAGTRTSWLVYETRDDGASFDVRVSHLDKPRGIDFWDRRAFAWDPHGAGWETLDAGKTWIPLPAPADGVPLAEEHAPVLADIDMEIGAVSRKLACGDRGCFVGDIATRIGWTGSPQ